MSQTPSRAVPFDETESGLEGQVIAEPSEENPIKLKRMSSSGARNSQGLQEFDLDDIDDAFAVMPKKYKYLLDRIAVCNDYYSGTDALEKISHFDFRRVPISIKTKTGEFWNYGTLHPGNADWTLEYEDPSMEERYFTDQQLIENCDDASDLDINLLTTKGGNVVYEVLGRQDPKNDEAWSLENPGGWDVGTLTKLPGCWVMCFTNFPNTLFKGQEEEVLLARIRDDTIRIRIGRQEDLTQCKANFDLVFQPWQVSIVKGQHELTNRLEMPMLYYASYVCDESSAADVKKILKIVTNYLNALHQQHEPKTFTHELTRSLMVVQDAFIVGCCYQTLETPGAEIVWTLLCDFIEDCRTASIVHQPPIENDRMDSPMVNWQKKVINSRVFSWNLAEYNRTPQGQKSREGMDELIFNYASMRYFEKWDVIKDREEYILPIDIAIARQNAQAVRFCIGHRHGERPWVTPSAGLGFFGLGAQIEAVMSESHHLTVQALHSKEEKLMEVCFHRLQWRLQAMLARSSMQHCAVLVLDSVRDQVIEHPDGSKIVSLHRTRALMLFGCRALRVLAADFAKSAIRGGDPGRSVAEQILTHPTFNLILQLQKIYVSDFIYVILTSLYCTLVGCFIAGFILYPHKDYDKVRTCAAACSAFMLGIDELPNFLGNAFGYLFEFYNYLNLVAYSFTIYLALVPENNTDAYARSMAAVAMLCLCFGFLDLMTYFRPSGQFVTYVEGMTTDVMEFFSFYSVFWIGFSAAFFVIINRYSTIEMEAAPDDLSEAIDSEFWELGPEKLAGEDYVNFGATLMTTYRMMLGDWDYEFHKFSEETAFLLPEKDWLIIFFFFYSVFALILMLNMIIAMMGGKYEELSERKEAMGTIVVAEQVLRMDDIADQKPFFLQLERLLGQTVASALYRCCCFVDLYPKRYEQLRKDLAKSNTPLFRATIRMNNEYMHQEQGYHEQPAGGGHRKAPDKKPIEESEHLENIADTDQKAAHRYSFEGNTPKSRALAAASGAGDSSGHSSTMPSSVRAFNERTVLRAIDQIDEQENWTMSDDIELGFVLSDLVLGEGKRTTGERIQRWLAGLMGGVLLSVWPIRALVGAPRQLIFLVKESAGAGPQVPKKSVTAMHASTEQLLQKLLRRMDTIEQKLDNQNSAQ